MEQVLDNPTQYGFQDATCGGNGDNACVWNGANPLHTGYTFQKLVAQSMVAALTPLGW